MSSHMTGKESNVIARTPRWSLRVVTSITVALLLAVLALPLARAGAATQASCGSATLPAGTRIMVRMVESVDSLTSQPDQRFRGSLETDLVAGNVTVAPKGTTVFGRLLSAESAGRGTGGQLEFDLTDIMINGQTYSLSTVSNQAQGQAPGSQAGTGAKTGAAVGAMAGGVSGAIRGAGAGAGAGTASGASTRGEKVKVPAGTLVEFTLDHPVTLPVAAR